MNFYSDNKEIQFELENSTLMPRIVELKERNFADRDEYPEAPQAVADALDSYGRELDVVGDIPGEIPQLPPPQRTSPCRRTLPLRPGLCLVNSAPLQR